MDKAQKMLVFTKLAINFYLSRNSNTGSLHQKAITLSLSQPAERDMNYIVIIFRYLVASKLHNEELHSLYRSPNIVRVIKSRRLRWAEHVARMEEDSSFKILTGKPT